MNNELFTENSLKPNSLSLTCIHMYVEIRYTMVRVTPSLKSVKKNFKI